MKLNINVLTLIGLCVGFVMTAFVAVWMLQGHLAPGDKMWATIIMCSTTAVMFVFIGEQNRREREMALRDTRRDAIRDRNMREEIRKLKDEFGASAQERARIHTNQELIISMLDEMITLLKLKNAKRSGYAAGFVDAAEDELGDKPGGKLRLIPPPPRHTPSDHEDDDRP